MDKFRPKKKNRKRRQKIVIFKSSKLKTNIKTSILSCCNILLFCCYVVVVIILIIACRWYCFCWHLGILFLLPRSSLSSIFLPCIYKKSSSTIPFRKKATVLDVTPCIIPDIARSFSPSVAHEKYICSYFIHLFSEDTSSLAKGWKRNKNRQKSSRYRNRIS